MQPPDVSHYNFRVPDPEATVKLTIIGLAAFCFNEKYTDAESSARKGRWEIALPRNIAGHVLTIDLGKPGTLQVPPNVSTIEIKDKQGVAVGNPKHEPKPFDRLDPENNDPHDYRWLADFNEISNATPEQVTPVKGARVTKLYIYDATVYAELDDAGPIVVASQANTGQIAGNNVLSCPDYHTGPILDSTDPIGRIAANAIAEIHRPAMGQGEVTIFFDGDPIRTYRQEAETHKITIKNMEPETDKATRPKMAPNTVTPPPEGVIRTIHFQYGRGDFYRYYELFHTPENKRVHTWEKNPKIKKSLDNVLSPAEAKTGDCNAVRLDSFSDLSSLIE